MTGREKRLLAALLGEGHRDIDLPDYGTTALTVLVEILHRISGKGEMPAAQDLAETIPYFLGAWRSMRKNVETYGETISLSANASLRLYRGNRIQTTMRGSSRPEYLIDHRTGRMTIGGRMRTQADGVFDPRIQRLLDHVQDRVSREMSDLVIENQAVVLRSGKYATSAKMIDIHLRTGYVHSIVMAPSAIRTQSDADLIVMVDSSINGLAKSQRSAQPMSPRMQEVQSTMRDMVTGTGLPVSIELVRVNQGTGHHVGTATHLIMTGYGSNGLLAHEDLGVVSGMNDFILLIMQKLEKGLAQQKARHEIHGPSPAKDLNGAWSIDGVLDMHARRMSGGHGVISEMLREGRVTHEKLPDVQIRIVGRQVIGTIRLGPKAKSHGGRITLDGVDLPETVTSGMKGQPIRDLVDHEDFPHDMTIIRCRTLRAATRSHVEARTRRIFVPLEY